MQIWRFQKIMIVNNIYVCLENIYDCWRDISPANKSLFVPALCSALGQVPDRHRDDPPCVVLEGEVGVRHLQCHGDSDQSSLSWNRKLSIFDTFWPRVAIFVFDPQQWRISWYCLNTLSDQNSPFRRPKRPGIQDRMLLGHRSSQRRLSRQEAERRRDDLKQGRNHGGLA